jgi:hypothetical protein
VTGDEAIAALVELVPPPERPTRPDAIDWAAFERENGFRASADYRLLVERYGIGSFGTSEDGGRGGWLSRRLGVAIVDIRNLEHERIWEDISEPA